MSNWMNTNKTSRRSFTCGYCENVVGPSESYDARGENRYIYICPNCEQPTYISPVGRQTPAPPFGRSVTGISDPDVAGLYKEVRDCTAAGAYSSAVMAGRKILMHVAVQKGADPNLSFVAYVDYLADKGWVPPDSKPWLDSIRQKGNDANHEIMLMDEAAAKQVVHFTEMLLRFVYELKSMVQNHL